MEGKDHNTAPDNATLLYDTLIIHNKKSMSGKVASWIFNQLEGIRKNIIGKILSWGGSEQEFKQLLKMLSLKGKRVYMIDMCFAIETMMDISAVASKVVVIDRHKSARGILSCCKSIPHFDVIFDETKCSAELTWEYLFGREKPWWIKHIRSSDLQTWEHKDSRAFVAIFDRLHISGDSSKFDYINSLQGEEISELIASGNRYLIDDINTVVDICGKASLRLFHGYKVLVASSTNLPAKVHRRLRMQIGETLSIEESCHFAVVFSHDVAWENRWIVSLRGDKVKLGLSNINLSELAKKYGGNGTPSASVFVYNGNINDLFDYC